MIRAVIFDMDELMIDASSVHRKATNAVLRQRGFDISSIPSRKWAGFYGKTLKDILAEIKGIYRFSETVDELLEEYQRVFYKNIRQNIKVMPGLYEILEMLRDYDLALASSGTRKYIHMVLDELELKDRFRAIVSGEDVKNGKPAPDIFLLAAKKLNCRPEDCVVLEDSANGVNAAKRAGMRCIGVENPHSPKQDLSNADIVVKSLKEITMKHIKSL
jgi:beta-phosphoglucomutase family hydrolase